MFSRCQGLRHCLLGLTALSILSAAELRALQRPPAACDQYHAAVRADPSNVDAAASLGRCSVRDYEMIAPGGDSTRLAFRSSWSTALRALRHAVELDPGYSRAYQPLFRILFAETRDGCSSVTRECLFVSPVLRSGDSVLTIPRRAILNGPRPDTYEEVVGESRTARRASLIEARALAERWAAVAPRDPLPHEYLGRALLRLGDPVAATAELELAATLGTPASRRALFWDRVEALVRSDRGDAARRVVDEAASDPARDTTRLTIYALAGVDALLGRYRAPPPDTSARGRALRERMDSIFRSRPPARPRPASFDELLAKGDTAGARMLLAGLDAELTRMAGMQRIRQVDERELHSAERHLALADTVGAEARLSEIERPFNDEPFQYRGATAYGHWPWAGRAWLLSGDVAAARGRREEASRMYRRVIGLWGGGDQRLKPVVDQARARLGALSAR
jgi:tetratricopeptide (TPR) repeat protein